MEGAARDSTRMATSAPLVLVADDEPSMLELVARLEEKGDLSLLEFFGAMSYRAEAVTSFLATLELIRLGVVTVFQAAAFGEIHARRTEAAFSAEQIRDTYR